jgi:hypothetical protein
MRTKAAIIESIILGIGVLLSIQGTAKAVGYSDSYIPYFLLAALGIVFIVILFLLRKKKFTFLLGIGFIIVYLYVAGFGYIVCVQNAARMRRLGYYEGKAIEITIGEDRYVWTGEAYYRSADLEPVDVRDKDASITIDGEPGSVSFVYAKPGEEDTIYYDIYSGSTGDYLVLDKS